MDSVLEQILQIDYPSVVAVDQSYDYCIKHKHPELDMLDADKVQAAAPIIEQLAFTDLGIYDIEFKEHRHNGYTLILIYYSRKWRR